MFKTVSISRQTVTSLFGAASPPSSVVCWNPILTLHFISSSNWKKSCDEQIMVSFQINFVNLLLDAIFLCSFYSILRFFKFVWFVIIIRQFYAFFLSCNRNQEFMIIFVSFISLNLNRFSLILLFPTQLFDSVHFPKSIFHFLANLASHTDERSLLINQSERLASAPVASEDSSGRYKSNPVSESSFFGSVSKIPCL